VILHLVKPRTVASALVVEIRCACEVAIGPAG